MPDTDALSNLRDIHLPAPISAWPPGPAYYALAALFIILMLALIKHKQYQNRTAPKREALAKLTDIENHYTKNLNAKQTAAEITTLLKRVALVYHPRVDVASLHSNDWLVFLEKTSKNIDFKSIQTSLIDTPFNPNSTENLTPLLAATRSWIKQRRKPCLN